METISGATVIFPGRGIVHTAGNSGRGPMRGIIIVSPGGAEHIFEPAEGS